MRQPDPSLTLCFFLLADAGAGYSTVYAQVGPYQEVSLHSLSPIFQVCGWTKLHSQGVPT